MTPLKVSTGCETASRIGVTMSVTAVRVSCTMKVLVRPISIRPKAAPTRSSSAKRLAHALSGDATRMSEPVGLLTGPPVAAAPQPGHQATDSGYVTEIGNATDCNLVTN